MPPLTHLTHLHTRDINPLLGVFRPFPRPHAPSYTTESAALRKIVHDTGSVLITVFISISVLIIGLLAVIRVTSVYDKWNESRGNEAIRVGRREMRLVRACERRGRGVLRRMEGERRERLGGEMERRERYLYEARADRERLGLSKKNKVEPVMSTVTATPIPLPDERASLGRTSRAPSLARTSLSYREPGTGAGIERRPTLREMRRNDMTQMQSDTPSDDVKRKMSSASRMPGGAEARIGQVFRRGSKRSIHMNTEPTTYFGASTMDRIKGRSSSHSHSHSHHSHSHHTNNQLDDKDGDTSTISKHNTVEGSSGSQTRDFALHVLEYAGIADSLLERELPELNRFSFEVGKERRIGLREGDEDEVEEEGARSPGDKGKGRME